MHHKNVSFQDMCSVVLLHKQTKTLSVVYISHKKDEYVKQKQHINLLFETNFVFLFTMSFKDKYVVGLLINQTSKV